MLHYLVILFNYNTCHLLTDINVEMCLRFGNICTYEFTRNVLLSLPVKEF